MVPVVYVSGGEGISCDNDLVLMVGDTSGEGIGDMYSWLHK